MTFNFELQRVSPSCFGCHGCRIAEHGALGYHNSITMNIQIRPERTGDEVNIEAVTAAAFLNAEHTSHTEQLIVEGLRKAGALTLSMVAEKEGEIVGHVAVSDGTMDWYGLGPVSVLPVFQRHGIGSQLIREVLSMLREMGAGGCVVLGDPRYYERFGFKAVPGLVLPDVPPEYFMALSFGAELPQGSVAYHAAFEG